MKEVRAGEGWRKTKQKKRQLSSTTGDYVSTR